MWNAPRGASRRRGDRALLQIAAALRRGVMDVERPASAPEAGAHPEALPSLGAHEVPILAASSAGPAQPGDSPAQAAAGPGHAPSAEEAGADLGRPWSAEQGPVAAGAGAEDPVLRNGEREREQRGVEGEAHARAAMASEGGRGDGAGAAPQGPSAVESVREGAVDCTEPSPHNGVEASSGAQEGEAQAEASPGWAWPAFDYMRPAQCRFLAWEPFRMASSAQQPSSRPGLASGNFPKSLRWSPDGACLMAPSEDCAIRIFDLPSDAVGPEDWAPQPGHAQECGGGRGREGAHGAVAMAPALEIREGDNIYSTCWYPCMKADDPVSCVLASTSKEHPIHLWDALTGELRASYRAYDHMDEICAAYSLAFSPYGDKLYAGYAKGIRCFDVSRPGAQSTISAVGAKGDPSGLKGMVSCLASSAFQPSLLAAGSYSTRAALFSADGSHLVATLIGHQGGVTQVSFSPDGNFLYSGARKDPNILCWDIRNTSAPVYWLPRSSASTNQAIAFDIEVQGRHLATGGQDGCVAVFDLATGEKVASLRAAEDTVTGVGYHPLCLPLLATCSGHRRFVLPEVAEGEWTPSQGGEPQDGPLKTGAAAGPAGAPFYLSSPTPPSTKVSPLELLESRLQAHENSLAIWTLPFSSSGQPDHMAT